MQNPEWCKEIRSCSGDSEVKIMDKAKASKGELFLRQTISAVLLAGMIILFIGVYYCVIKAGIPCQDPPLELQVQYAVNMGIGEILVKNGFLICICGGIARLIFQLAWRKGQKK